MERHLKPLLRVKRSVQTPEKPKGSMAWTEEGNQSPGIPAPRAEKTCFHFIARPVCLTLCK